jgi:hypothetical protein
MKIKVFIFFCLTLCTLSIKGQSKEMPQSHTSEGQRVYKLIVREGDNKEEFSRAIQQASSNRGLLGDIVSIYRSTFVGQITSASKNLIESGANLITGLANDNRPKWETAIRKELSFSRTLPMQQEILDFYKSPSSRGPLDPSDMLFSGFGCRQSIQFVKDSTLQEKEVFYLSCKIRTDSIGRMRILNHSKFEVIVDTLRFNPSLCDLPNDSLGMNTENRIGFSFDSRKNLKFNIKAIISSSWINQAMQVFTDQKLGEFNISAEIDPKELNTANNFVYYGSEADSSKIVKVTGDCFLIPRSYVGNSNGMDDMWGTGQYKVEIQVAESCQIKEDYYINNGKWQKNKWEPEWKMIKKRKPSRSTVGQIIDIIGTEYKDNKWITTITEPAKTVIIQYGTNWINAASNSMPTSVSAQPSK